MNRRKDDKNRVLKEGEYQRKNGSYEFKWRTDSGQRRSIYAPTLEELRKKEDEITLNILQKVNVDGSKITINELFDYWDSLRKNIKDSTRMSNRSQYNTHIRNTYGHMRCKDVKKSYVISIYNDLSEKGLKCSTISLVDSTLKQMFELLVDDDIIRKNPVKGAFKKFSCGKEEKTTINALTAAEQFELETFLAHDTHHYDMYPLITIMLWTGMRVGEAGGLRWCDVDLENGIIDINHTLLYVMGDDDKAHLRIHNTPKTKSSIRKIPMLPIVKDMFKIQRGMGKRSKRVIDGYSDFIFLSRHGNPIMSQTLDHRLNRIVKRCNEQGGNLPHIQSHMLRHSFATRMCEAGVNMKVVQNMLGHARVNITLDIYTNVSNDFMLQELENKVIGTPRPYDQIYDQTYDQARKNVPTYAKICGKVEEAIVEG